MDCKDCQQQFSYVLGNQPRIIIGCGHSLCHNCISSRIEGILNEPNIINHQQCNCAECGFVMFTTEQILQKQITINNFPVNQALLTIRRSMVNTSPSKEHNQSMSVIAQFLSDIKINGDDIDQDGSDDFLRDIQGSSEVQQPNLDHLQSESILENFKSIDQNQDIDVQFAIQIDGQFEDPLGSYSNSIQFCQNHANKKIEAYCDNCKCNLCMDCILTQDHKNHEIISVATASQQQRIFVQQQTQKAQQNKSELEHQILRIKAHLNELEGYAASQRGAIDKIFNDVRVKINEREQVLKKRISDSLQADQTSMKSKIQVLHQQCKLIDDLSAQHDQMESQNDIQVLSLSKHRHELCIKANQVPKNTKPQAFFTEINRDAEVACIIKQILPKSLKSSLMSGTLISQLRRQQNQEDIMKRELLQQQRNNVIGQKQTSTMETLTGRRSPQRDIRSGSSMGIKSNREQQLTKKTFSNNKVTEYTTTDAVSKPQTIVSGRQRHTSRQKFKLNQNTIDHSSSRGNSVESKRFGGSKKTSIQHDSLMKNINVSVRPTSSQLSNHERDFHIKHQQMTSYEDLPSRTLPQNSFHSTIQQPLIKIKSPTLINLGESIETSQTIEHSKCTSPTGKPLVKPLNLSGIAPAQNYPFSHRLNNSKYDLQGKAYISQSQKKIDQKKRKPHEWISKIDPYIPDRKKTLKASNYSQGIKIVKNNDSITKNEGKISNKKPSLIKKNKSPTYQADKQVQNSQNQYVPVEYTDIAPSESLRREPAISKNQSGSGYELSEIMQLNMEELKEIEGDSEQSSSNSNPDLNSKRTQNKPQSRTRRVWDKPSEHNAWKKNTSVTGKTSIYDRATKLYHQHKYINTGSKATQGKSKGMQNQSTACLQGCPQDTSTELNDISQKQLKSHSNLKTYKKLTSSKPRGQSKTIGKNKTVVDTQSSYYDAPQNKSNVFQKTQFMPDEYQGQILEQKQSTASIQVIGSLQAQPNTNRNASGLSDRLDSSIEAIEGAYTQRLSKDIYYQGTSSFQNQTGQMSLRRRKSWSKQSESLSNMKVKWQENTEDIKLQEINDEQADVVVSTPMKQSIASNLQHLRQKPIQSKIESKDITGQPKNLTKNDFDYDSQPIQSPLKSPINLGVQAATFNDNFLIETDEIYSNFRSAQSTNRKLVPLQSGITLQSEEMKEQQSCYGGSMAEFQGSQDALVRKRQQMCKMNQKDSRNSTLPSPLTDSARESDDEQPHIDASGSSDGDFDEAGSELNLKETSPNHQIGKLKHQNLTQSKRLQMSLPLSNITQLNRKNHIKIAQNKKSPQQEAVTNEQQFTQSVRMTMLKTNSFETSQPLMAKAPSAILQKQNDEGDNFSTKGRTHGLHISELGEDSSKSVKSHHSMIKEAIQNANEDDYLDLDANEDAKENLEDCLDLDAIKDPAQDTVYEEHKLQDIRISDFNPDTHVNYSQNQSDQEYSQNLTKYQVQQSMVSHIFEAKEEFIFVFGGQSNYSVLNSIEVFDVHREIWRLFDDFQQKSQNDPDRRIYQKQAISFYKDQKNKFGIQKDIIHLIGGKEDMQVDEFNIRDMQTFQADWRLPFNLYNFASASSCEGIFIAGGHSEHKDEKVFHSEVYMVTVERPLVESSKIYLGTHAGTDQEYLMQQIPNMIEQREDFTLVFDQSMASRNGYRLFAIGGAISDGSGELQRIIDSIESYNSIDQRWVQVASLMTHDGGCGRRSHQSIALPDSIYIIGGFDGKKYLNNLTRFDPNTYELRSLPPMNIARASFTAELSSDCSTIYVIGGYNKRDGPLKSVEKFDIVNQKWDIVSPMHQARFMHASQDCMRSVSQDEQF